MHIRRLTFTPCIGTVAQHLVYALCGSHASFQTHLKAHGSSRKRHRYHRRDFPDTLTNGGAEIGATPQRGTEGAGATAPPPVFTVVPTAHINMRMESQVESYLRGQEKQREAESQHRVSMTVPKINVINVPRSPLKRAVLDFDVRGQQVRAVGQSKRVKVARALCCMHAVQLIDHFSVDAAGRDDAPPPLEEEVISAGPYGLPSMHSSKHLRRPSTPSYPTWEPGAPWENYVGACEKYIRHQQQQQRAEAYAQLRIPPSGNPLVDRAADLTQQQRQCDNLALQKLNNEILHATKDMQVVRISRRIFAATLLLDGASHLCATGVASTLREAKQRCAMHALSILKLVREQRLQSGAADDAALPSNTSSHGGVSLSLSPRYAKLLDFFTLLCDVRPKPSFTKEGKKYTCELRLDGTTCKGSGINRFEAERNAVEGALSEMELYDERLQAINSIISRYPKIVPQCVPTVKLPEDLGEAYTHLCGAFAGTTPVWQTVPARY
uniref:WGS project CAEQ00000000 data, annotated contig 235 n=1 Tax=Trypanosoma congolense (strain IL3000) TaxID=1068625 RepID=F9WDC3_TRYCI|nr:unnamed protein product [Trypanosoma congolense IL3000]